MRDYLVNIPRESDDKCSLQESFCDVAGKWLDEKRPFIKQSSSNKYANLLENYVFPSLGTLQITDVSQDRINNLVKQLLLQGGKRGQPLSNKTIHDILFIITQAHIECHSRWYICKHCREYHPLSSP